MIFPTTPRYKRSARLAYQFLVEEGIIDFPVDPFKIIEKHGWTLITYSEYAKEKNVSIETTCKKFRTKDGWVHFDGEHYTIYYNDTQPFGRIRFTLMHEIGHIYLNHLTDFEETIIRRGELTKEKYKILEDEANVFARNVLAPAPIVKKLKLNTIESIASTFSITHRAAKTRLDLLWLDLRNLGVNIIFKLIFHFNAYINSWACLNCNNIFILNNFNSPNFCPVCNNTMLIKKFFIKGVSFMKYDGYELDENGRALICPKCKNEEITGDYCKICGIFVVNKCANVAYDINGEEYWACNTIADGNARFCIKCGHETTFFKQKLLKPWEEEKKEKEKKLLNGNSEEDETFEISEDDLPF